MEFAARIQGRTVHYPASATFIVERREKRPGARFGLLTSREDIGLAIAKFNRSKQAGQIVRLSACYDGRILPLARG